MSSEALLSRHRHPGCREFGVDPVRDRGMATDRAGQFVGRGSRVFDRVEGALNCAVVPHNRVLGAVIDERNSSRLLAASGPVLASGSAPRTKVRYRAFAM